MAITLARVRRYREAADFLDGREVRKIAHNTYLERRPTGSAITVRFHFSDIVTYTPEGSTILDSHGYRTFTTKDRINDFCPEGFGVYQDHGAWYLWRRAQADRAESKWGFADGLVIDRDGNVTGAESAEAQAAAKALGRRIRDYARGYVKALQAGEIPAPGPGDCFFCAGVFTGSDGREVSPGTDHLTAHFEESYFVPSLLAQAVKAYPVSIAARAYIGELWAGRGAEAEVLNPRGIITDDIRKCLAKYLRAQFGLPR
jgi:hypothetical protein